MVGVIQSEKGVKLLIGNIKSGWNLKKNAYELESS
jgi:hypothetical protein